MVNIIKSFTSNLGLNTGRWLVSSAHLGFFLRSAVPSRRVGSPTDFFSKRLPERQGTNGSSGRDTFHLGRASLWSDTLMRLLLFFSSGGLLRRSTWLCLEVPASAKIAAHLVRTWSTTGRFLGRQLLTEFSLVFVFFTSTNGVSLMPNLGTCTEGRIMHQTNLNQTVLTGNTWQCDKILVKMNSSQRLSWSVLFNLNNNMFYHQTGITTFVWKDIFRNSKLSR